MMACKSQLSLGKPRLGIPLEQRSKATLLVNALMEAAGLVNSDECSLVFGRVPSESGIGQGKKKPWYAISTAGRKTLSGVASTLLENAKDGSNVTTLARAIADKAKVVIDLREAGFVTCPLCHLAVLDVHDADREAKMAKVADIIACSGIAARDVTCAKRC